MSIIGLGININHSLLTKGSLKKIMAGVKERQQTGTELRFNYFRPIYARFADMCESIGLSSSLFFQPGESLRSAIGKLGKEDLFYYQGETEQRERVFAKITAAIDIVGELAEILDINPQSVADLSRERMESAVKQVGDLIPDDTLVKRKSSSEFNLHLDSISDQLWNDFATAMLAAVSAV